MLSPQVPQNTSVSTLVSVCHLGQVFDLESDPHEIRDVSQDPDRDGFSNIEEYANGTSPRVENPSF